MTCRAASFIIVANVAGCAAPPAVPVVNSGRFNPAEAPEAVGGVGVDVRMAHQVLGAAPT